MARFRSLRNAGVRCSSHLGGTTLLTRKATGERSKGRSTGSPCGAGVGAPPEGAGDWNLERDTVGRQKRFQTADLDGVADHKLNLLAKRRQYATYNRAFRYLYFRPVGRLGCLHEPRLLTLKG